MRYPLCDAGRTTVPLLCSYRPDQDVPGYDTGGILYQCDRVARMGVGYQYQGRLPNRMPLRSVTIPAPDGVRSFSGTVSVSTVTVSTTQGFRRAGTGSLDCVTGSNGSNARTPGLRRGRTGPEKGHPNPRSLPAIRFQSHIYLYSFQTRGDRVSYWLGCLRRVFFPHPQITNH